MAELTITSVHNPRVKAALALRHRKGRNLQDRFLIDGVRELTRALAAGVCVIEVFVCPALMEGPEAQAAIDLVRRSPAERLIVAPHVFARLAYGDRAEGLIGVARQPERRLADIRLPDRPLVAVLDGIEKPGNVGAVVRSADAAGVSAVIVTGQGTDLYNANCIRASLGTLFAIPVCSADPESTLDWLRANKLSVYAARPDADRMYSEAPLDGPTALILGSEATGLAPVWTAPDIVPLQIPMLGQADSLNVSATAAILFYEALRQRTAGVRVETDCRSPG